MDEDEDEVVIVVVVVVKEGQGQEWTVYKDTDKQKACEGKDKVVTFSQYQLAWSKLFVGRAEFLCLLVQNLLKQKSD